MNQPGTIGYVLINYDGIPVKQHPEDVPAVQYSALVSDLVMKTKSTLKQLNGNESDFVYLRMRTKQNTELIVTDYISGTNEYILVTIQSCKFAEDEEEEEEEENKWWSPTQ